MPIFIDRHYVEGATPQLMAQAHEQDLKIQGKYGVQFITYWFDVDRGTSFCLINAPDKAAIQKAHNEAHGDVPHEIVEVDPSIVNGFLGRMQDPEPDKHSNQVVHDSAFRSIMFTDLKDSTLMTTTYGDKKGLHLLHIHNSITRNALRNRNGREVKHTGDGIMASFDSVSESVYCAIDIQLGFVKHNAENPKDELFLRIGINAGEPIEEHGDLFGNVVQLAARLCNHAEPGQIIVSSLIQEECINDHVPFINLGAIELKGFNKPVQVFEVKL